MFYRMQFHRKLRNNWNKRHYRIFNIDMFSSFLQRHEDSLPEDDVLRKTTFNCEHLQILGGSFIDFTQHGDPGLQEPKGSALTIFLNDANNPIPNILYRVLLASTVQMDGILFAKNSGYYGAAILAIVRKGQLNITNSQFIINSAYLGGAILYKIPFSTGSYVYDPRLALRNVLFKDNRVSGAGGAFYYLGYKLKDMSNIIYENNTALGYGKINATYGVSLHQIDFREDIFKDYRELLKKQCWRSTFSLFISL